MRLKVGASVDCRLHLGRVGGTTKVRLADIYFLPPRVELNATAVELDDAFTIWKSRFSIVSAP